MINITQTEEIYTEVLAADICLPVGNQTKPGLKGSSHCSLFEMTKFSGMIEYTPSEYVFTAYGGTKLGEVEAILGDHGQFLPFDPPFIQQGATLGGTIAAGLSGSGRYRYGGLRDFILGVRYVDGQGRAIRAGGKVVKNAAGFDIPKLMVGSLGQFGAILEVSFKVFPKPIAYQTIYRVYPTIKEATEAIIKLSLAHIDLFCIDLVPGDGKFTLYVRIGGDPKIFPERSARLSSMLGEGIILSESDEQKLWVSTREFTWVPEGSNLVKVPITPNKLSELDGYLDGQHSLRRYAVGGNLAWVGWDDPLEELSQKLLELKLPGLVILGRSEHPRIGFRTGEVFEARVKKALDPTGRWMEV